jgi:hypothetical protein
LFLDVVVFSFMHCLIANGVDEIHRRLHQTRRLSIQWTSYLLDLTLHERYQESVYQVKYLLSYTVNA